MKTRLKKQKEWLRAINSWLSFSCLGAIAFLGTCAFAFDFNDVENGLRYAYRIEHREPFGDVAVVTSVWKTAASFTGTVPIPDTLPGKDVRVPVIELGESQMFWRMGIKDVKNLILPPSLQGIQSNVIERLLFLERLEMPLWLALEAAKDGNPLARWHPYASPTNSSLELVMRSDPSPFDDSGLPLCELPVGAFKNLRYVDTIVLPSTVQAISTNAFYCCSRLRRVLCDVALEDLTPEFYAEADVNWRRWQDERMGFYNPTNVLRNVNTYAFAGCRCLQEVDLPPCVERIAPAAFCGCTALRRIGMPEKLKVLGHKALSGLYALEDVTFGTNLVMVGQTAFASCRSLKHVRLPESVIAFPGQTAMLNQQYQGPNPAYQGYTFREILAPLVDPFDRDYIQFAPAGLFLNCTSLESVELGGFWTPVLPAGMFQNCTSLTNVVLPSTDIKSLASPVFRGCTALEELTVPDTVQGVNTNAFILCPNLKRIKLSLRMMTIPANAFRGMVSLEEVTVSPRLTQISSSAFENCSSLRLIDLPDTLRKVGSRAFWGCTALEHVHFSRDVATLSNDVFEAESRVSVDIEPSVRKTELFGNGKVRVLSAAMSATNPGKMVVRYEVVSSNATIHAYPLAFVGGGRSFARVVRPITLENAETDIPANEERTITWDVGADLGTDFSGTIQFGFVSDAGTAGTGTALDGLFLLYAEGAEGMELTDGVLSAGGMQLANGTEVSAAAAGYLSSQGIDPSAIIHGESQNLTVHLATHRFLGEVVLDGRVQPLFHVPGGADGASFGGEVMPVVADVNGDGLFDIVVATSSATNFYLNTGSASSPEFRTSDPSLASGLMAASASLADYPSIGLAVRGSGISAEELNVVILDWDGDGGTDALCGTRDGRLMLIADQTINRVSGLAGEFSPTSVNLFWNPCPSPAVRGYRVYRSLGKGEEAVCLEEPFTPLPRIADSPLDISAGCWYRVTAVCRRYVAGNSEPEYTESAPSDFLFGMFGRVELLMPDVTTSTNGTVDVLLSLLNTMDVSGNGARFTINYDPEFLTPVRATTTGLSEGFNVNDRGVNADVGEWKIVTQGGKCPEGCGAFLRLRFEVMSAYAVTTTVSVAEAAMSVVGSSAEVDIMPVQGNVIILPPPQGVIEGCPAYSPGDLDGNGVLDMADLHLLARLKNGNGQHPTADQLRAGDFNGNGKLDNADYQTLRALLKEKGKIQ